MDLLKNQELLRKNGERISAEEALREKKVICFYFSAHWCPPCRKFTFVLADFYSKVQDQQVEVIFVSFDRSPEQMTQYMEESHGNWLALPHDSDLALHLKKKYCVTSIPTLIVVGAADGRVIAHNGRAEVTEFGVDAAQRWTDELKYSKWL